YTLYFDTVSGGQIRGIVSPSGTPGSAVNVIGSVPPVVGVWYFYVFWHDPVANKIYLQINNGTPAEAAVSGGTFIGSANFRIGAYDTASSLPFDGLID